MIAAKDGQEEVALALIDAGADTNTYSHSILVDGPHLLEGLRRHNTVLFQLLLDADANPNYGGSHNTFDRRQPAIELAVK